MTKKIESEFLKPFSRKHRDLVEAKIRDVAKIMFLIGLQSEELSRTVGSPVDLKKAWGAMSEVHEIETIMANRDLFMGSLFENQELKNNKNESR